MLTLIKNIVKKLVLLNVLFILGCCSELFAQDYMSMSKKELRIEHKMKLTELSNSKHQNSALNSRVKSLNGDIINLKSDLRDTDIELEDARKVSEGFENRAEEFQNRADEFVKSLNLMTNKYNSLILNQEIPYGDKNYSIEDLISLSENKYGFVETDGSIDNNYGNLEFISIFKGEVTFNGSKQIVDIAKMNFTINFGRCGDMIDVDITKDPSKFNRFIFDDFNAELIVINESLIIGYMEKIYCLERGSCCGLDEGFFALRKIESTEISQEEEIVEIEEIDEAGEIIDDVHFAVIENVPIYPGCESAGNNAAKKKCMSSKIQKFVQKKFNTDLASDLGLEGIQQIYVQFKIDKTGNITNVQARVPHPKLKQEAINTIKALPKMTPGKQRGQVVGVLYSLPIQFQIEN